MPQPINRTGFSKALPIGRTGGSSTMLFTPNVRTSGTATNLTAFKLIDTSKNFTTINVSVGDIVVATNGANAGLTSVVTAIDSATTLSLSLDIIPGINTTYTIYSQGSYETVAPYVGAILYNASNALSGQITGTTLDGTVVNFYIPIGGTFPLLIASVSANSNIYGNIIALW